MHPRRAIFLDRDGVVVEDVGPVVGSDQLRVIPGVPEALRRLHDAGFVLLLTTNQSVVARGLITEAQLEAIHAELGRLLVAGGGPTLDASYYCPHHPNATLPAYRVECACRKPRSGMLHRGRDEYAVDLSASYMIGDRLTDIIAGAKAGCRTILVETGKHEDPPIQTSEPLDLSIRPDRTCADLGAAADWILANAGQV